MMRTDLATTFSTSMVKVKVIHEKSRKTMAMPRQSAYKLQYVAQKVKVIKVKVKVVPCP